MNIHICVCVYVCTVHVCSGKGKYVPLHAIQALAVFDCTLLWIYVNINYFHHTAAHLVFFHCCVFYGS